MSAGMAGIIAEHSHVSVDPASWEPGAVARWSCHDCGAVESYESAEDLSVTKPVWHGRHVAEELAKAGYGNIPDALREAAGEMPIETLGGADKVSAWLRTRAWLLDTAAANLATALNDKEGRALVQAIHHRKAGA